MTGGSWENVVGLGCMDLKVGVVKSRMWFSKLGLENRDAPAAESTIVPHVIGRFLVLAISSSTVLIGGCCFYICYYFFYMLP
jgi:hypothetical protein